VGSLFAGQADKTLADLFAGPQMAVVPTEIVHLAEPSAAASHLTVQIGNAGTGGFTWTAAITPTVSWLAVHPLSDSDGQALTLAITAPAQAGCYATSIRITAGDPEVKDGLQTVAVRLLVAELYPTYLPLVVRLTP